MLARLLEFIGIGLSLPLLARGIGCLFSERSRLKVATNPRLHVRWLFVVLTFILLGSGSNCHRRDQNQEKIQPDLVSVEEPDGVTRVLKKETSERVESVLDFVLIAGMSGDPKTVGHVYQVLNNAGIQCTYEGSVMYDLYVEPTKVKRALELLRAEQTKGWRIFFKRDRAPGRVLFKDT